MIKQIHGVCSMNREHTCQSKSVGEKEKQIQLACGCIILKLESELTCTCDGWISTLVYKYERVLLDLPVSSEEMEAMLSPEEKETGMMIEPHQSAIQSPL